MHEFTSFVEFMEAGGWDESERGPDDCARRCAEFGICPTLTEPEWLLESAELLDFFHLHAFVPKEWADMGRSLRMRMGEILGYSEAWSSQESFLSQALMQLLYAAAMAPNKGLPPSLLWTWFHSVQNGCCIVVYP